MGLSAMTEAICIGCGELKFGAFNICKSCGGIPRSDDELMLSLALTDHHLDSETLRQIGCEIKRGKRPRLGEADQKRLYPAI
jgi:hypothetical protein